jgi:hypothetical protein
VLWPVREADDLIKTMSCEPNIAVYMALVGVCRVHGDVEIGEWIIKQVLELDPGNARLCAAVEKIDAADKWYLSANIEQQRKEGVGRICHVAPGLK